MNIFIKTILIIFLILNMNYFANATERPKSKHYKQTIAIDLDGVLNDYTKYDENKIPEIRKGAKDFIKELYSDGYNIILFTNRNPLLASKWLIDNGISDYFSSVTNVKPMAKIYIDDRAINFNGSYEQTIKDIKDFNIYWQK